MKTLTPILAIAFVMLIALSFLSFKSLAQNKTLVADETELITLKKSYKVVTCNTVIFKAITDTFNGEGFKYTCTTKKDRTGLYMEYSISFKEGDKNKLDQFFKKLNN